MTPRGAVLIALESREEARLIEGWLAPGHEVAAPDDVAAHLARERFDLCIVDGPTLDRHRAPLAALRAAEAPAALPVLLLTSRPDLERGALRDAAELTDEILVAPAHEPELAARVAALLRTRRLALDLARRSAETEALLHGMAHDLRTPLNTILLAASPMPPGPGGARVGPGREELDMIARAGRQMRDILAELLRFAALGRGGVSLAPVDLRAALDECARDLEQPIAQRGAELLLPPAAPPVIADAALLKVALAHLLANAIKFVAPGAAPRVQVTAAREGARCRVEVRDNGPGIPAEKLQKLFLPFSRLQRRVDAPGNGLGLSSVRKALELMGGRCGVTSTVGEGSTFWIDLAAAGDAPAADAVV